MSNNQNDTPNNITIGTLNGTSNNILNLNLIPDFTFPSDSLGQTNMNVLDKNISENFFNSDYFQNIFEEVANKPEKYCYLRQCRCWVVPKNINTIQPGQYCIIPTAGGGGSTEWYYYKTLNKRHMLIFASLDTITMKTRYTGREIPDVPK